MCLSTSCPALGRSWGFCLMRGCTSLPSVPGLSVDAAAGCLWAEGPQRLSLQQTPRAQLHPRLFNRAELPTVLHMGQHHPRKQPVQSLPRYCAQPRMCTVFTCEGRARQGDQVTNTAPSGRVQTPACLPQSPPPSAALGQNTNLPTQTLSL